MTTGSIQIGNHKGIHKVSVDILDENSKLIGEASLSMFILDKDLLLKWESIVKEIVKQRKK